MTEILDYVPGHFRSDQARPPGFLLSAAARAWCKSRCRRCRSSAASRALAPLAHVIVGKYCDHLPLYRQSGIYAREGVDLDRATLADWVGKTAALASEVPGRGCRARTSWRPRSCMPTIRRCRFWHRAPARPRPDAYGSICAMSGPMAVPSPPAVVYRYSPDRRGEHPRAQLAKFRGFLQADGYSGFGPLYETAKRQISDGHDRGCVLGACAPQVLRHSCRDQRADRGRGAGADRSAVRHRARGHVQRSGRYCTVT